MAAAVSQQDAARKAGLAGKAAEMYAQEADNLAMDGKNEEAARMYEKAAAAVARLNLRRALKFKKPDPRVAAPGGNLSRKLALNLSNLPAPTAQIRGRTPLKRVTFSRESSAGPRGSFEVRAWTPTSR